MLSFLKNLFGSSSPAPTAEELHKATIIDVRTPGEFNQGHAPGSVNIPLQQIGRSVERIKALPQPIYTCCKSGTRSGMATRQLKSAGLDVTNLGTWRKVTKMLER